jgi:hypothetical protein
MVGGMIWSRMASVQASTSIAPDAPMAWPSMDLLALMGTR